MRWNVYEEIYIKEYLIYAIATLQFLEANGNLFNKDMNPLNVPHCRPIEHYRAKPKESY